MNFIDGFEIGCGFGLGVYIIKYITEFIKRKKKK